MKDKNKLKTFKEKFSEWRNLTSFHDPQTYQDYEWDWEDELQLFEEDPDKAMEKAEKLFRDKLEAWHKDHNDEKK